MVGRHSRRSFARAKKILKFFLLPVEIEEKSVQENFPCALSLVPRDYPRVRWNSRMKLVSASTASGVTAL